MSEVPKLDLAETRSPNADRFGAALRDGLLEYGFVRVVNHGVDAGLIERAYREFERFFALPEDEKAKVSGVEGGQRGFTPFGIEHARDHATPDLKEFFHVGRTFGEDSPLAARYPRNVWPDGVPELRGTSLALFRALEACAERLLEALAIGFGLGPTSLSDLIRDGNSILRALHYPPVAAEAVNGRSFRAAPHEDINLITLLCGATDSGLEILTREGAWIPVETRPDEIVADAGDMLARISNDQIPATTHRVVVPAGGVAQHRYALPFFAHPHPDCDLSVIDAFVPAGEAPRHAPISAGSFLEQRLREIGLID